LYYKTTVMLKNTINTSKLIKGAADGGSEYGIIGNLLIVGGVSVPANKCWTCV